MATNHPVHSQLVTYCLYNFVTLIPYDTNHLINNETTHWLPVHTHIHHLTIPPTLSLSVHQIHS